MARGQRSEVRGQRSEASSCVACNGVLDLRLPISDRRHLTSDRWPPLTSRFYLPFLFSFAEYLAACCEDEDEENPP
jgi:hypothetical protein